VTAHLLDINVLIALVDEVHASHNKVQAWFRQLDGKHWATCPLTEAGFVRILSNPAYPAPRLDVHEAVELLSALIRLPGHRFWPADLSLGEAIAPFQHRLFGHKQVSDAYLLGLAIKHKGTLATLDRGVQALAGDEFARHLLLLPA